VLTEEPSTCSTFTFVVTSPLASVCAVVVVTTPFESFSTVVTVLPSALVVTSVNSPAPGVVFTTTELSDLSVVTTTDPLVFSTVVILEPGGDGFSSLTQVFAPGGFCPLKSVHLSVVPL
jgi:hypothetical protein